MNLSNLKDKEVENNFNTKEINNEEENPFMEKLSKIDILHIKVVRFLPNKSDNFTVRAENLLKLTYLITKQKDKNIFEA
jgi:hypothetical protein